MGSGAASGKAFRACRRGPRMDEGIPALNFCYEGVPALKVPGRIIGVARPRRRKRASALAPLRGFAGIQHKRDPVPRRHSCIKFLL